MLPVQGLNYEVLPRMLGLFLPVLFWGARGTGRLQTRRLCLFATLQVSNDGTQMLIKSVTQIGLIRAGIDFPAAAAQALGDVGARARCGWRLEGPLSGGGGRGER
jgi:hypothetical protein